MVFGIDFDGTLVLQDRPYGDVVTPLQLRSGAFDALRSMKAAGHVHLLWSERANRSLLFSPTWDPLHVAGIRVVAPKHWDAANELHWARYEQMVRFAKTELAGLIDAIDDGLQGKPVVDMFLEDKTPAGPIDWDEMRRRFGAW